ncbi:dna repair [Cystoisospora suis]|uniref:Dna repair n=1 Tax=Cystoisospora suis TaxID=483139 RepID=A0A2C6JAV8_9APIC|nr:dna repair [Cystoisospora suis]
MDSHAPVPHRLPRPQRAMVSQVCRLISCSTTLAVSLLQRARWNANDAVDLFFTQSSLQGASPQPSGSAAPDHRTSSSCPVAGFRTLKKPPGRGRLTRQSSASPLSLPSRLSSSEPVGEQGRTCLGRNTAPVNVLPSSSPDAPICLEDTSDCGSPGPEKQRRRSCSPSSASVSPCPLVSCTASSDASANLSKRSPPPVHCGDAVVSGCSPPLSCRTRSRCIEVSAPAAGAGALHTSEGARGEEEPDGKGKDLASSTISAKRRPNSEALQAVATYATTQEASRFAPMKKDSVEGDTIKDSRAGGRKDGRRPVQSETGKVLRVLREKYSWRRAIIEKGKAQLSSGDVGANWKPYLGLVTLEATIVTAAFVKPDRALNMAFVGDIRVQLASGSSFFGSRKAASKLFRVDPHNSELRREVAELLEPTNPSRVCVKKGATATASGRGLPPVLALLDSISDSNCTLRLLLGEREAGRVQRTLSKELLFLLILGVIEVQIAWVPGAPPAFPLRVGSSVNIAVHVFLTSNLFRLESVKNRVHLDLGSQCSSALQALFSAVGVRLRSRQDCPQGPDRRNFSSASLEERMWDAKAMKAHRVEEVPFTLPDTLLSNEGQCMRRVTGAERRAEDNQLLQYRNCKEVGRFLEQKHDKKQGTEKDKREARDTTVNEDEERDGDEEGSDDDESVDAMNRLNDLVLGTETDAGEFPDTPSMPHGRARAVPTGQDVASNVAARSGWKNHGPPARMTPHPLVFRTKLRPYQEEGLAWMLSREADCKVSKQQCVGVSPAEQLQYLPPSWFCVEFPSLPSFHSSSSTTSSGERQARGAVEEGPRKSEAVLTGNVGKWLFCNFEACAFSVSWPTAARVIKGGILGDAMGLGKTVQLLSLVSSDLLPAKACLEDSPSGIVGVGGSGGGEDVGEGILRWGKQAENKSKKGDDRSYDTSSCSPNETEEKAVFFPPPLPEAISSHLKPDGEGFYPGGTLIVVPLSLLSQWRDEITAHFHPGAVSVYEYYGTSRTKDLAFLASHTIVLTTYQTLASDFRAAKLGANGNPDFGQGQKKTAVTFSREGAPIIGTSTTMREREKGAGDTLSAAVSPLHAIFFYRIVLDEGHLIKSVQSSQCQAACALHGERRWMLTGTPLQNDVSDAFALAKFLKLLPAGTTAWWNANVAQPMERGQTAAAIGAVRGVLLPLMLRRHANSRGVDGKPILPLPPITLHCFNICLTPFERELYMAFFTRSREEFERLLTAGVVMTNYSHVLLLLLRLRQLCCHPSLVTARGGDLQRKLLSGDLTEFDKLLASLFSKERAKGTEPQASGLRFCCICASPSSLFVNNVVQDVRDGRIEDCPICLDFPAEPVLLVTCCHTLCHTCALSLLRRRRNECPICRVPFQPQHVKLLPPPSLVPISSGVGGRLESTQQKRQADHDAETKKDGGDGDLEGKENCGTENGFFFSTKLKIALALVSEDMRQGRSCVIFSQWTSMLDTIEEAFAEYESLQRRAREHARRALELEAGGGGTAHAEVVHLPYRRLDGSMTSKQRQDVLAWFTNKKSSGSWTEGGKGTLSDGGPIVGVFRDLQESLDEGGETAVKKRKLERRQGRTKEMKEDKDSEGRILLCSLKAGNVGLNLTRASRCYLMDGWWNPQVENQAMKRIWRFGQDKPVEVIRFVCVRTVEERLEEIKEFKGWMARGVCESGAEIDNVDSQCLTVSAKTDSFDEDKQRGRLSIEDLKRLFRGFETEELAGAEILESRKYPGPGLLLLGHKEAPGAPVYGAVQVASGVGQGPEGSPSFSAQQVSERTTSPLDESFTRTGTKVSLAPTSENGPDNGASAKLGTGSGYALTGASEGAGPPKSLRTSGEIPSKRNEERGTTPSTEERPYAGNVIAGAHERHFSGILLEDRTARGLPSNEAVHVPVGTVPSAFRDEAEASATKPLTGATKELISM